MFIRSILLSIFGLHAIITCGQVPELAVKDSTLLKTIDIFLDSAANHNHQSDKFIIAAVISNLEVLTATQRWYQDTTKQLPLDDLVSYDIDLAGRDLQVPSYSIPYYSFPSCKFVYREREVYIFFRAEYFVEHKPRDLKRSRQRELRKKEGGSLILWLSCHVDDKKIKVLSYSHLH